jgi:hypothetical protein
MSNRQVSRMNEMNRRNAGRDLGRFGIAQRSMAATMVLMALSMVGRFFGRFFGGNKEAHTEASVPKRPCLACGAKTDHPNGCCSAEHYDRWITHLGPGRGFGRIVKPLYL